MITNYSVLMSVYYKDNPEWIRKSIESILNQTVKTDDFVIVMDGPVDGKIEQTIADYQTHYPDNIRVVKIEKNSGLGHALNVGLTKCKNNLVARMDSDDIAFEDRCEKLLQAFGNNSDLVICGGQIEEFIGSTDNVVSRRIVPTDYDKIVKFSHRRSPFNHPTVMFKRDIILKYGGYPSSGRKEDLDLFLLLLSKGCYAINLPDFVLHYRTSEDNFLRRKDKNNCDEWIAVIKKYYKQGYCSLGDYIVVWMGQTLIKFLPACLIKLIGRKVYRK